MIFSGHCIIFYGQSFSLSYAMFSFFWRIRFASMRVKLRSASSAFHTGTRAKHMDVRMTTRELHVSCNGKKILGGRLHRPIRPGESTWTIEDGDKVSNCYANFPQ